MHPQGEGVLHYHIITPCMVDVDFGEPLQPCNDVSECKNNLLDYIKDGYTERTLEPIGLARDGHVIWGPYKNDGSVW